MDALPFLQELATPIGHLRHQPPHVRLLDPDDENQLGPAIRPIKVDLRLTRSGDMDMRRVVIGGVDHEAETKRTVNDDHKTR
jgi:hypothetical protein